MTLPKSSSSEIVKQELVLSETALTQVSTAVSTALASAITQVLSSPELSDFVEGLTRSKAISGVLQGLATADGRKSLDARVLKQNAIEISHAVDMAIDYAKTRMQEQHSGVELDPEIHDGEKAYLEWKAKNDKGVP